jgi:ribonuclease R
VGAIPVRRFSYTDDRRPRRREGHTDHGGQRRREIEIPEEIHVTSRMYQKLAKKIAGTPEERILSYLMLRSLKQARYAEENAGHFALAAPAYTHFTSPIRRYPDLIVHRILKQVLWDLAEGEDVGHGDQGAVPIARGIPAKSEKAAPGRKSKSEGASHPRQEPKTGGKKREPIKTEIIPLEELHDIAKASSGTERRADEAERELMEWKKAKFMVERVGEDFDGLIVSVTKFGFFVELTDMFIEGLVPLSSLMDDRYVYHDSTRQIIGQRSRKTYSMGDRVRVLIDRVDPVQRKIQFAVLPEQPVRREKRRKKA